MSKSQIKSVVNSVDSEDTKRPSVSKALNIIRKKFGEGSIMTFAMTPGKKDVDVISTGALSLDIATGVGGVPRGRIIEIFGKESTGKTSLCLSIIACVQEAGGVASFVDAEHALSPTHAQNIGVRVKDLLISQPNSGEEGLSIVEELVKSNAVDLIVVDSVAALVPQKELDGEMGDAVMGLQARLMSQAMRKLTAQAHHSKVCVIFINQLRDKIGVMWGSPSTTPGGKALKFYASMRIDLRRVKSIKRGDVAVGNRVKATVVKNKVAPPFRTAEFDLLFSEGISHELDLIEQGILYEVIEKSGSWLSYKKEKLGHGKDDARIYLKEHKDTAEAIKSDIMSNVESGVIPQDVDEEKEEK